MAMGVVMSIVAMMVALPRWFMELMVELIVWELMKSTMPLRDR